MREAVIDLAHERDALHGDLACLVGAGSPTTSEGAVERVANALSR